MAQRANQVSELFRNFADWTIRATAPEGDRHTVADLFREVERQTLKSEEGASGNWTADELGELWDQAGVFEQDLPLSDFVDVPRRDMRRSG